MSIPPEASPDWCFSCCKLEPLPEDLKYHRVCGECGHVYMTPEELVNAFKGHYEPRVGQMLPVSPEEIYTCPLCGHDF